MFQPRTTWASTPPWVAPPWEKAIPRRRKGLPSSRVFVRSFARSLVRARCPRRVFLLSFFFPSSSDSHSRAFPEHDDRYRQFAFVAPRDFN